MAVPDGYTQTDMGLLRSLIDFKGNLLIHDPYNMIKTQTLPEVDANLDPEDIFECFGPNSRSKPQIFIWKTRSRAGSTLKDRKTNSGKSWIQAGGAEKINGDYELAGEVVGVKRKFYHRYISKTKGNGSTKYRLVEYSLLDDYTKDQKGLHRNYHCVCRLTCEQPPDVANVAGATSTSESGTSNTEIRLV